jgi:hypothetical protein
MLYTHFLHLGPFHVLAESAYSIAFEENYMDPRGFSAHYRGEISVTIKEWVKNPKNYIMPYIFMVMPSMMGKS